MSKEDLLCFSFLPSIAQADLVLLSKPLMCWDCTWMPSLPVLIVLP